MPNRPYLRATWKQTPTQRQKDGKKTGLTYPFDACTTIEVKLISINYLIYHEQVTR
jgi:hypothetical protein